MFIDEISNDRLREFLESDSQFTMLDDEWRELDPLIDAGRRAYIYSVMKFDYDDRFSSIMMDKTLGMLHEDAIDLMREATSRMMPQGVLDRQTGAIYDVGYDLERASETSLRERTTHSLDQAVRDVKREVDERVWSYLRAEGKLESLERTYRIYGGNVRNMNDFAMQFLVDGGQTQEQLDGAVLKAIGEQDTIDGVKRFESSFLSSKLQCVADPQGTADQLVDDILDDDAYLGAYRRRAACTCEMERAVADIREHRSVEVAAARAVVGSLRMAVEEGRAGSPSSKLTVTIGRAGNTADIKMTAEDLERFCCTRDISHAYYDNPGKVRDSFDRAVGYCVRLSPDRFQFFEPLLTAQHVVGVRFGRSNLYERDASLSPIEDTRNLTVCREDGELIGKASVSLERIEGIDKALVMLDACVRQGMPVESGSIAIDESGSAWKLSRFGGGLLNRGSHPDWVDGLVAFGYDNPLSFAGMDETQIEELWGELSDVPVDEEGRLESAWRGYPAGTDREEIWHDFDEAYEGGVHGLMFPDDEKQTVGSYLEEMQSIASIVNNWRKSLIPDERDAR